MLNLSGLREDTQGHQWGPFVTVSDKTAGPVAPCSKTAEHVTFLKENDSMHKWEPGSVTVAMLLQTSHVL